MILDKFPKYCSFSFMHKPLWSPLQHWAVENLESTTRSLAICLALIYLGEFRICGHIDTHQLSKWDFLGCLSATFSSWISYRMIFTSCSRSISIIYLQAPWHGTMQWCILCSSGSNWAGQGVQDRREQLASLSWSLLVRTKGSLLCKCPICYACYASLSSLHVHLSRLLQFCSHCSRWGSRT